MTPSARVKLASSLAAFTSLAAGVLMLVNATVFDNKIYYISAAGFLFAFFVFISIAVRQK